MAIKKGGHVDKFPKNQIEAANLVQVDKRVGLLNTAIEDDIRYLLYQFLVKESQSFHSFDDLWHDLHFSYVHFACVNRDYRNNLMNAFYSCLLDYFVSDMDSLKCAVIYALYYLYMSQPMIWDKIPIRVTKETWIELVEFYASSIENNRNSEAALLFDRLRSNHSFVFVVSETMSLPIVHERIEFENTLKMLEELRKVKREMVKNDPLNLFNNEDIATYDLIANQYQTFKELSLYTPEATIAAQKMIKERLNVTENKPRLLQNVIVKSGYNDDETELIRQLHRASKRAYNYRSHKKSEV